MFEGTKLSYIVPGYTGHIPKSYYFDDGQPAEAEARHQIPGTITFAITHNLVIIGYIGYIPSIKSENLYGKSYGKLTYDVSAGNHHKGQEIPPDIRYTSTSAGIFQDQKNVPLRSAAEIVGVKPTSLQQEKPLEMEQVNNFFGLETTEKQKESDQLLRQSGQKKKGPDNQEQTYESSLNQFYGAQQPSTLKLGQPIPGYTGTTRRVMASNIFGQTFANSLQTANQDQNNIDEMRKTNFKTKAEETQNFQR